MDKRAAESGKWLESGYPGFVVFCHGQLLVPARQALPVQWVSGTHANRIKIFSYR